MPTLDPKTRAVVLADEELLNARASVRSTMRRIFDELVSGEQFFDEKAEQEWLCGVRAEARFVTERVTRAVQARRAAIAALSDGEDEPG